MVSHSLVVLAQKVSSTPHETVQGPTCPPGCSNALQASMSTISDEFTFATAALQVAHLNAEARSKQCVAYFKLQQQLQSPGLPPAQVQSVQKEVTTLLCRILGRSACMLQTTYCLATPASHVCQCTPIVCFEHRRMTDRQQVVHICYSCLFQKVGMRNGTTVQKAGGTPKCVTSFTTCSS